MLLPALAAAKKKAQRTQCLGNMRQIGLAIQMYANDNHDSFPDPNWGGGVGWLYTQARSTPPPPDLAGYASGELWDYLKTVGVYWCPADATNSAGSTWPNRVEKLSTYIMNGAVIGYNPVLHPFPYKQSVIRNEGIILWEPDDTQGDPKYVYSDGSSYPYYPGTGDYGMSRRHLPGCNLLYIDGHVQFQKYEAGIAECKAPASDGPNEFWWNPGQADGRGGAVP